MLIPKNHSYNRKIKSQIKRKLENFELPLLVEKGLLSLSSVTKFGNGVTKYSNADIHSSSSNSETCAQMKSLERDLIPRPFPYQVSLSYQGTSERNSRGGSH